MAITHSERVAAVNARIRQVLEKNEGRIDWTKYPRRYYKGENRPNRRNPQRENALYWMSINPIYLNDIRAAMQNDQESELLSWGRISQILSETELRENKDLISWKYVAINRNAKEFILENIDRIAASQQRGREDTFARQEFSSDILGPNIGFISGNPTLVDNADVREMIYLHHGLHSLCGNSNDWATKFAIYAIEKRWVPDNAIGMLSNNTNPIAIKYLKANPSLISWDNLLENPAAADIIRANPDRINWHKLSANPAALNLLEANLDKVDWEQFCAYNFVKETDPVELVARLYDGTGMLSAIQYCSEGKDLIDYEMLLSINPIENVLSSSRRFIIQTWPKEIVQKYEYLHHMRNKIAHRSTPLYQETTNEQVNEFRMGMVFNHIQDQLVAKFQVPDKNDASNAKAVGHHFNANIEDSLNFVNTLLQFAGLKCEVYSYEGFRDIRNKIMHEKADTISDEETLLKRISEVYNKVSARV